MPRQAIYWSTKTLMLAPRKAKPNRREAKYLVVCQTCGYERWLTKTDANKACITQACRACHSRELGRKCIARHGDRLRGLLKQYRMDNPSSLELMVMTALEKLGLDYEREIEFPLANGIHALIDFKVFGKSPFFLEANGLYYHGEKRQGRDNAVKQSCNILSIPLLVISDFDPYSGEALSLELLLIEIARFNKHLAETPPF